MNIALIGPGLVGKEFLNQISQSHAPVALKIVAVMSSKCLKLGQDIKDFDMSTSKDEANLDKFISHCLTMQPCIVVDCTSSVQISSEYPRLLEHFHVVTPNKKAFSGPYPLYKQILEASLKTRNFVYHESTVGAGLPILSTLRDLVETGDSIIKVEGIFSGTLSYIFNRFSSQTSKPELFSDIVKNAKELGYTEPDPRDDLNGMDVARKIVILSRVSGNSTELDAVNVGNIVPAELREIADVSTFMARLSDHDSYFANLNEQARKDGCVLRYVGSIDEHGSSVKLQRYPYSHPFAALKGSDNIIAFTTKRFKSPLIIQGAGAGDGVTAFGMFSDVLKIARSTLGPL